MLALELALLLLTLAVCWYGAFLLLCAWGHGLSDEMYVVLRVHGSRHYGLLSVGWSQFFPLAAALRCSRSVPAGAARAVGANRDPGQGLRS